MTLIGMPEVARRMETSAKSAKRSLRAAGVPLVEINSRALAVDDADLETYLQSRQAYTGRGRPPGAKNKAKDGERDECQ